MHGLVRVFIWVGLVTVAVVPVIAAMMSPLLEWRQPIYIVAGVAGIMALALLLFQPMLACGLLPGITRLASQKIHSWIGVCLVLLVVLHVVGLWLTSPPDVIDALLFRSPTSFSPWGVVSMWALFASAGLVVTRRKLKWRVSTWQLIHRIFGVIIVTGTVVHTLLIDGTMENSSKWLLCTAVIIATVAALLIATRSK